MNLRRLANGLFFIAVLVLATHLSRYEYIQSPSQGGYLVKVDRLTGRVCGIGLTQYSAAALRATMAIPACK